MAEANDTTRGTDADREGTAVFRNDCDPARLYDAITLRVSGVRSMATIITGEGLEPFQRWSDDIQGSYLFELAARLAEIEVAIEHLGRIASFTPKTSSST